MTSFSAAWRDRCLMNFAAMDSAPRSTRRGSRGRLLARPSSSRTGSTEPSRRHELIGAADGRSAEVPARVGARRHDNLGGPDAGQLVAVVVRPAAPEAAAASPSDVAAAMVRGDVTPGMAGNANRSTGDQRPVREPRISGSPAAARRLLTHFVHARRAAPAASTSIRPGCRVAVPGRHLGGKRAGECCAPVRKYTRVLSGSVKIRLAVRARVDERRRTSAAPVLDGGVRVDHLRLMSRGRDRCRAALRCVPLIGSRSRCFAKGNAVAIHIESAFGVATRALRLSRAAAGDVRHHAVEAPARPARRR